MNTVELAWIGSFVHHGPSISYGQGGVVTRYQHGCWESTLWTVEFSERKKCFQMYRTPSRDLVNLIEVIHERWYNNSNSVPKTWNLPVIFLAPHLINSFCGFLQIKGIEAFPSIQRSEMTQGICKDTRSYKRYWEKCVGCSQYPMKQSEKHQISPATIADTEKTQKSANHYKYNIPPWLTCVQGPKSSSWRWTRLEGVEFVDLESHCNSTVPFIYHVILQLVSHLKQIAVII